MKKRYITPTIKTHHVALSGMIAQSFKGGGKGPNDPVVGGIDFSDDENRTKAYWDFEWAEEEE